MPQTRSDPLIDRLAGVDVLVIGDAMLDQYVVGNVERISPEAPVPIVEVQQEFNRVGGAANVAANVTALGGEARLVCLVGRDRCDNERDPDAELLLAECTKLGFEPELLRFLPRTIRKVRILAGRQQQILRVDYEHHYGRSEEEQTAAAKTGAPWEPLPLPPGALDGRRAALAPLLEACQAVLVSDYAKGMVDQDLMDQLRASGKPVIVDPRPQHTPLYKSVHLVTPNRKEAARMLGLDPRRHTPPEEMARALAAQLDCSVLLTLGSEGMLLHGADSHVEHIPTRAREVFDVTGAGDTVAATVALALGAGLSESQAAHLANAAAGIVVGHIGTATASAAEVAESLQAQH